jgi:hypothetical protein
MDLLRAQESGEKAEFFGADVLTSTEKDARRVGEVERLTSSLAQRTFASIEGLEGLTSDLQELQRFLKTEVERVQAEIDSALAGIQIIMETISPWKMTKPPLPSQTTLRGVRSNGSAPT